MAALVLGAAGAFVGSFFGPLGASLGWSIGSAIGSSIGQKGTEGPKLTDLKLQTGSYGTPIPILWGTGRWAGICVWQTDLIPHTQTTGGKGGGQKSTTTSYSASFAVKLCQTTFIDADGNAVNNPILGIKRIWANKRLIWNQGTRVGGTTELPITIYYGTDTQTPDPTMEAYLGAGNVSAHRGFAYVVCEDWPMAEFGNQLPSLEFETHASGVIELTKLANWDVDWELHGDSSTYSYHSLLNGQSYDPLTKLITATRWRDDHDYGGPYGNLYQETRTYTLQGGLIDTDSSSISASSIDSSRITVSSNSNHMLWNFQFDTNDCEICTGIGGHRFLNTSAWTPAAPNVGWPICLLCETPTGMSLNVDTSMFYHAGFVYGTGGGFTDDSLYGGPGIFVKRWPVNADGEIAQQGPDATFLLRETISSTSPNGRISVNSAEVTVGDDGFVYVIASSALDNKRVMWKLTRDLTLVYAWDPLPFTYSPGYGTFTVFQNHVLVSANNNDGYLPHFLYGGFYLYRFEDDHTFTFITNLFGLNVASEYVPGPTIHMGGGLVAWRGGILTLGGETTLDVVVADISNRMGLGASDVDVTDLTDVVHGYAIGQQMTGRAAVEGLMPAFRFDAVESDRKAKFVKRGHPTIGVVTDDDLGAHPASSEPVPLMSITRTQEAELPRRIYVRYLNQGSDYQDGTQIAQRQVTESLLDVSINLAVVMTDSEAKITAESLLASAWVERDRFKFATPRKWAHVEPTDIWSPQGFPVRVTQKSEEGGVVNWEGVGALESAFIQIAPAVPPSFVPQPTPIGQGTDMLLMDLPLVKDSDYANGWYAAMAGRVSPTSWPGSELERSIDAGANYSALLTATTPNVFGYTTTILPNWTGGNFFDESSTVDVIIGNGAGDTLSSATELAVYNGANLCVIGDELVQFKNATLTATNKYTLSGLLRGRRGTEWAMDTHLGGEQFCMLPAINVNGPFDELGVSMLFKAVTAGAALSTATAETFTNDGEALRPYAPVHLGGGRNAAGDIIINWVRRTRIGGSWKDYVNVPLSEVTESYQLNFYTSGAYTSNPYSVNPVTNTYTFTAADQTTFMGGAQNPLYFGVTQDGSYQTGHEARGVV